MDSIISFGLRVLKPLVVGLIMFFSLQHLGFSTGASAAFALVPVLLGTLNIFSSFVYGLTGLVFIAAAGSSLWKESDTPEARQKAAEAVESLANSPALARSLDAAATAAAAVTESVTGKPAVATEAGAVGAEPLTPRPAVKPAASAPAR